MVYRLALLLEGEAVITCGRHETPLRAGDFYCDDGSRPHEIRTGPIRAVGAVIPEALLPLSRDGADRVLGHRIPGRDLMARCSPASSRRSWNTPAATAQPTAPGWARY